MSDLDEWFPNYGVEAPKGSQDKTEKSHDENLFYKIQIIRPIFGPLEILEMVTTFFISFDKVWDH